MGVGARARRAVRVCDIMGPVTLSVCGGRGVWDPCTPGPDLMSRLTRPACMVVSLVECVRGHLGRRGLWRMWTCLCVRGPRGAAPPAASLPYLMRWHAQSCVCVCMCAHVSAWLCWALPVPSTCDCGARGGVCRLQPVWVCLRAGVRVWGC